MRAYVPPEHAAFDAGGRRRNSHLPWQLPSPWRSRAALMLIALAWSGFASAQSMLDPARPLVCSAKTASEPAACARALLARIRGAAEHEFIAEHGLHARDEEIDAVRRYERAFACHDRSQRSRKLAELQTRLSDPSLDAAERAWLREFRATLERLAAYEAKVDRGLEPAVHWPPEAIREWVEQAKLDAMLYRRYGGAVGLTAAGANAHGARAALVADYVARYTLAFPNAAVQREFFAVLRRPPAIALEHADPDFTPFWQRPLRASYVAAEDAHGLPAHSDTRCASIADATDRTP